MKEIVQIGLDNEMDLILAHKRCMKLAELCGLPHSSQTRLATAISEIARCAIHNGTASLLKLGIEFSQPSRKSIIASITDDKDLKEINPEAYYYAQRIAGEISYSFDNGRYETQVNYLIPQPGLITENKCSAFVDYFRNEAPFSPYDEIRKKNLELISLSEKLADSEANYRNLANSLPLLIFNLDSQGRVSLSNQWFDSYLPTSMTLFDGRSLQKVIHADDIDKVITGWDQAKLTRSTFKAEVRLRHQDAYFWHLLTIVPANVSDDSGNRQWTGFFVDVDAQKQVEIALQDNSVLREMQAELEHSNASLSVKNRELEQFAFIASHDLQEPLRKIMILTSRINDFLPDKDRGRGYLERIQAAAERMSNLIKDVLNYSRLNHGNDEFAPVNLNLIVEEVRDDLHQIIEETSAELSVAELPVVLGIDTMIRQLLFNLISNALKFNDKKPEISIYATVVEINGEEETVHLEAGTYHCIHVSDNGIGIEEKYGNKIFNMFQRLHAREAYQGNGIGLALCRRIAEHHQGSIDFVKEKASGTTFRVFLPA